MLKNEQNKINIMRKFELQNFNLHGIWNALLMRDENALRLNIFEKRLHHAYIGFIFLLGTFAITIPAIPYWYWAEIGTGLSFIVHDVISEIR